jgi:hypothetical protein
LVHNIFPLHHTYIGIGGLVQKSTQFSDSKNLKAKLHVGARVDFMVHIAAATTTLTTATVNNIVVKTTATTTKKQ